ncbi:hypothetical protein FACS189434_08050 [Bacteroidia bacterium]|nr:hypothetical protein FACS189434_08050 [Bacteroidia bacterium]
MTDLFLKRIARTLPFLDTEEECACSGGEPVLVSVGADVRFLSIKVTNYVTPLSVQIIDLAGNMIKNLDANVVWKHIYFAGLPNVVIIDLKDIDLQGILAVDDCFAIKLIYIVGTNPAALPNTTYSTPFIFIGCNTEDTVLFEYWDGKEDYTQKARLSCILDKPNAKTERTEYEQRDGYVRSLASKRRKEYELTFDFYSEERHDAIRRMLQFPKLLVDGEPMYEIGDYEIDWENQDTNGKAKAETKLSEQEITAFSINE